MEKSPDKKSSKKKLLWLLAIPALLFLCIAGVFVAGLVVYEKESVGLSTGGLNTGDSSYDDYYYTDEYKAVGSYDQAESAVAPEYEGVLGYDPATISSYDSTTQWGEKVIKTGTLTMVVEDLDSAVADLKLVVETEQGYITSLNDNEGRAGGRLISVVFKVPQDRFDSALTAVKEIADEVMTETVDANDVTQEYTDLQSRLTNLRSAEEQYLTIMTKATDVEDILAVQSELTNVREEIEMIQGQINYYDSYTSYSTITVYMSVSPENIEIPEEKWRPWAVVVEAWKAFLDVMKGVYAVLIWVVVFSPIVLVPVIIIKLVKRAKKNK